MATSTTTNLDLGPTPTYRVFRILQSTGETEILATLSGSGIAAAYIHSFFLTTDFVILCLWPSFFANLGANILWERNILDSLAKFGPKAETRWLVIDRKHNRGLVAAFTSSAIFSYHTVNAWQEESADGKTNIFCDLVQYPNLDNLHALYYDNLMSTGPNATKSYNGKNENNTTRPTFARYRLAGIPNLSNPSIRPRTNELPKADLLFHLPSPSIGEFPTISPLLRTQKARYVYSILDRGLSSFFDGLVKTDLETKEVLYWEQPKHTPGEAIFVPDPSKGEQEDAGWLLSVVLDGERGVSYLLVLDAGDMTEVGRADVGMAVGFGFHGVHVPL
jgi:torulene dioxygenase